MIDKIEEGRESEVTTSMVQRFKDENKAFPWPELEDIVAERLEMMTTDGIHIADDDEAVIEAERGFYRIH